MDHNPHVVTRFGDDFAFAPFDGLTDVTVTVTGTGPDGAQVTLATLGQLQPADKASMGVAEVTRFQEFNSVLGLPPVPETHLVLVARILPNAEGITHHLQITEAAS